MKNNKTLIYIFLILFFVSSCKTLEKKANDIKNKFRIKSSEEIIKNNIEISVSCGDDVTLQEYIKNGWNITKEYSEEKICSWKTIAASKDCNIEKDKGCKIVVPDKIGEEKFYILEK